jgi:hypothetical protein
VSTTVTANHSMASPPRPVFVPTPTAAGAARSSISSTSSPARVIGGMRQSGGVGMVSPLPSSPLPPPRFIYRYGKVS